MVQGKGGVSGPKKKKKKREKEIRPKSHTVDKDEPKTDFGLE